MKSLGFKIKLERVKKCFTQEQLAIKSGLSVQTINHIERNKYKPQAQTIGKICNALNIPIEKII